MYNKSVVHGTALLGAKENTEVGDTRPTDKADLGHQASGLGQILSRQDCSAGDVFSKCNSHLIIDMSPSVRSDVVFRDMNHRVRCSNTHLLGVVD